jgi:hypothetical protein
MQLNEGTMATKMAPTKGTYHEKVEDSSHQDSKKFGGYAGTSTIKDSGKHNYSQKSGAVKDSGS